ncbi:3-keto-disaccharide hydrolase [Posidoniimonas polymericola]|nr:DUF1080 domain-containing protein [Posidoniimonas polymericola]
MVCLLAATVSPADEPAAADSGRLEFRIVAEPTREDDQSVIEVAQQLPPGQKTVTVDGEVRARWVELEDREFGPNANFGRLATRNANGAREALVLIDPLNVTEQDLAQIEKSKDETGRAAISFELNDEGADRFGRLTGDNLPDASGRARRLGVLVDGRLISAPSLRTRITSRAQISGGSMTDAEVDQLVQAISANIPPSASGESVSLFNGQDLTGWHADVPERDNNPEARMPFVVRDGMLVSLGTPGGHLITDEQHGDYRLEVEYRFAGKPGNCGVLVHASQPRALYGMFPQSLEVQMMHENAGDFWCIHEDIAVPDMVARRGPKEKWGGRDGDARRIVNLTDGSEKPLGEWNRMVVECLGNQIKVWVNGDLVNHGHDCTAKQGQIAVQAEGSEVEFRKLLLTPITELSDAAPE